MVFVASVLVSRSLSSVMSRLRLTRRYFTQIDGLAPLYAAFFQATPNSRRGLNPPELAAGSFNFLQHCFRGGGDEEGGDKKKDGPEYPARLSCCNRAAFTDASVLDLVLLIVAGPADAGTSVTTDPSEEETVVFAGLVSYGRVEIQCAR